MSYDVSEQMPKYKDNSLVKVGDYIALEGNIYSEINKFFFNTVFTSDNTKEFYKNIYKVVHIGITGDLQVELLYNFSSYIYDIIDCWIHKHPLSGNYPKSDTKRVTYKKINKTKLNNIHKDFILKSKIIIKNNKSFYTNSLQPICKDELFYVKSVVHTGRAPVGMLTIHNITNFNTCGILYTQFKEYFNIPESFSTLESVQLCQYWKLYLT